MAKKKNHSNHNEKKINNDRKNDENDGSVTVVLKIDMHCEGCAGKIVKSITSLEGVKSVERGEGDWKEINVKCKVDPVELCENVERKIKQKVELISPAIKKQQQQQPATMKNDDKPKKLPVTTTVLNVTLHCQGCIEKIQKLVRKTKGFVEMSIDESNDLVTVKGAMDMNLLTKALHDKLKRTVEVVQAKGDDGKKAKGDGGDQGEGKEKESGGGGPTVAGYNYNYNYNMGHFAGQGQYMYHPYVNRPEYTFNYMHATRMFDDENPNACVVM